MKFFLQKQVVQNITPLNKRKYIKKYRKPALSVPVVNVEGW